MLKLPSHSKEAADQSSLWLALKSFGQTAALWCLFLWLVPTEVSRIEARSIGWKLPSVNPWICWLAFWALAICGFYCGALFVIHGKGTPLPMDATKRFVVLGPYRYVRNPMALFGISQGVLVGVLLRSPLVVAYALVGGVAWHFFARPWEERDLLHRFGADYQDYRREVPTWRPRLTPYKASVWTPNEDEMTTQ